MQRRYCSDVLQSAIAFTFAFALFLRKVSQRRLTGYFAALSRRIIFAVDNSLFGQFGVFAFDGIKSAVQTRRTIHGTFKLVFEIW